MTSQSVAIMDFGFKITDLAKMLNEVDPDRRHQKDSDSEDEPGFKLGNQGLKMILILIKILEVQFIVKPSCFTNCD